LKHLKKNDKKILNAWASYDWANSVYNLTITAAVFPVYYSFVTRQAFGNDYVLFFGIEMLASVLYGYAISFSFLLAALLSPILSGIADYSGRKKLLMKFFTYMGASACFTLFFFTGENIELGIIAAVLASVGYSGAIVFYLSFLPEIATDDRLDGLSAKGFSLGFLGSVVQLTLSLVLIQNPSLFGLEEGTLPTRLSFLFVALWWVGFAQIAFYYLPNAPEKRKITKDLFSKGFEELAKVWKQLKHLPETKRFLWSFFFYNMGAQSIMLLATIFADKVLKLESYKLIGTILLLQIVGIAGAYIFAFISNKIGNKKSILVMLFIWLIICAFGYFLKQEWQFYAMATSVGLVMGGIHISRSTYAKLIPADTKDNTSFFSFYDITEKIATTAGTYTFGLVEALTHNIYNGILLLLSYFIIGIILIWRLKIPRGEGNLS